MHPFSGLEPFTLNKLIRTGPLAYAQRQGGLVFAHPLTGAALFDEAVRKTLEELGELLDETIKQRQNEPHKACEELGDVYEALDLLQQSLANANPASLLPPIVPTLRHMAEKWQAFLGITPEDLAASIAAKQAKHGKFEGWYVNIIALPNTNTRWLPYYRERYPACPLSRLEGLTPLPPGTFESTLGQCT